MIRTIDMRSERPGAGGELPRATVDREEARAVVREIVASVRSGGDAAALSAQARFGVQPVALRVPQADVQDALDRLPSALRAALEVAADRVRAYHERQAAEERAPFWRIGNGGWVGEETRPVARAGCYVPGGRAAYPSSVLMTVIPARIAGVGSVAVCVPPGPDGRVHQATLAACALARADEVFALGGAQAIAAMAYGTETIEPVEFVCGPGNLYVTLAKHEVAMDVGVDGFAGPTEIAIVADDQAPPAFIAADMVAQAEHDPLATALLVTPSQRLAEAVVEHLEKEVASTARQDDVAAALRDHGAVVLVRDLAHAVEVVDAFAPEHLEIVADDAETLMQHVRNAGAVFVGPYTPVALGDYVAGTNHVLPTARAARFGSPLRVGSFIKSTAVVGFDKGALEQVAPALIALAEAEGLDAHARAVRIRLEAGS